MSASFAWISWCWPIGLPIVSRVFAYSSCVVGRALRDAERLRATPGRERSRMRIAILEALASSPSRFAAGMRQPSKVELAVVEPEMPIFGSSRATAKPGVSASTTNGGDRRCPASGSVFAKTV
jgi:hypothetical protein